MRDPYSKIFVYTVAGFCGVAGFIITYIAIGYLFKPAETWIENKMR
ncbi:gp151 [Bacillus phage G]|uniref:Gp151 n=1 Tax=Bacillus phage G TaxID=2884420 RepID=G3MBL7_9CAUD|nr:gp151 [Bacillus phage G]AEO93411.1 gp151 [Bacillus phage G]